MARRLKSLPVSVQASITGIVLSTSTLAVLAFGQQIGLLPRSFPKEIAAVGCAVISCVWVATSRQEETEEPLPQFLQSSAAPPSPPPQGLSITIPQEVSQQLSQAAANLKNGDRAKLFHLAVRHLEVLSPGDPRIESFAHQVVQMLDHGRELEIDTSNVLNGSNDVDWERVTWTTAQEEEAIARAIEADAAPFSNVLPPAQTQEFHHDIGRSSAAETQTPTPIPEENLARISHPAQRRQAAARLSASTAPTFAAQELDSVLSAEPLSAQPEDFWMDDLFTAKEQMAAQANNSHVAYRS